MRDLLGGAESKSRGLPWDGPHYASEILDVSDHGVLTFVCEVEMVVGDVDTWADRPLGRKPVKGIRYEWPG
jgi:hypothetical protein